MQPPNFQQYLPTKTHQQAARFDRRLASWDRAPPSDLTRRASRVPFLLLLVPIDTPEVVLRGPDGVQVIFAAVKGLPDVLHATEDCLHCKYLFTCGYVCVHFVAPVDALR
nr:unnamed protein product [Callosobruchus analis]